MKTAMQELIDDIGKYIKVDWPINKSIRSSINKALEKEKEQIIDAHTNAYLIGEDDISVEDANEASIKYYNQTYNK